MSRGLQLLDTPSNYGFLVFLSRMIRLCKQKCLSVLKAVLIILRVYICLNYFSVQNFCGKCKTMPVI